MSKIRIYVNMCLLSCEPQILWKHWCVFAFDNWKKSTH